MLRPWSGDTGAGWEEQVSLGWPQASSVPGPVAVGGVAVAGQIAWGHHAQQLQQVQTVL